MRLPRLLAVVPVLALTLTACGSDPGTELRDDVESVTLAANDGDADAVRAAVEDLLSTIRAQVASRELPREEAERLRAIALRIAQNAALLDPEPTPSPTPEPEPTQEPEPVEEPTPTPTPEPSEEPEPTEEPTPTQEPEESDEPIIEVSPAVGESPSPSPSSADASKGSGKPLKSSPSPTPA